MAPSANPSEVPVSVGASEPAKQDFRSEVTDRIIHLLETGVAPWQKPWNPAEASTGMPMNPTTGKSYRGGNAIRLMATALLRGFADPRWMTYKQAAAVGWQVRRGAKGTQIEFWEVKSASDMRSEPIRAANGNGEQLADGPGEHRSNRLVHRVYTVFNAKQIEGVPECLPKRRTVFEVVEAGERILNNSGAIILHDQADRAFYQRSADKYSLASNLCFPGRRRLLRHRAA